MTGIMACEYCGGTHAPGVDRCPWCGSYFKDTPVQREPEWIVDGIQSITVPVEIPREKRDMVLGKQYQDIVDHPFIISDEPDVVAECQHYFWFDLEKSGDD